MNHKAITNKWTQRVVIDLGLCPFAAHSIAQNRLALKVVLYKELDKIMESFMEEIYALEKNKALESSLISVPHALSDFEDFLDAWELAKQLLADAGFEGVYQIAIFHPQFQFAGTEADDPSNYTNRSPFPIFHPIRETAMTQAIASHPDIDSIPNNNIEKMRSLGIEHVKTLFENCFKSA